MAQAIDLAALKKVGTLQQRDKEYFILRFRLVGGDIAAQPLAAAAEVARRYGRGEVHLTTRQGLEIPWIHHEDVEEARAHAEAAGLKMGACGPRVRVIVACPGSTICRWGIIDTKAVARRLDADHFGRDTPHKFKMAVTGCPHNCAKPQENDVGITGGVLPRWEALGCTLCNLCVSVCPTGAIVRTGDTYRLDEDKCLYCTLCTNGCPTGAWKREREGCFVSIGGTLGKIPRLATRITGLIEDDETVYRVVERSIRFFQDHGRKRERFGHTLDRMGLDAAQKEILDGL